MKKFYLFLLSFLSLSTVFAGIITSTTTGGNWTDAATWVGGVVPIAADDVIIANGAAVTVDNTVSCNSLTIGGGISGILKFSTITNTTLTVSANVSIVIGAAIRSSDSNPAALRTHSLLVGGDFSNAGTLDFSAFTNSRVNTTFTGAANNSFTTSATAVTTFNIITINKGTSSAAVLDFNPSNTVTLPSSGFLNITNGTFKVSGSVGINNPFFQTATYILSATGGFWLNNNNAVVTAQAGNALIGGLLQITAGIYNIGTTAVHALTSGSASTNLVMQGGTLNVSARLQMSTAGSTFTMAAGIINVATVGNSTTNSASFAAAGNFNMSGGAINIGVASTGATRLDYNVSSVTPVITGGTLQLGTSSTTSASSFRIQGATPNMVVSNASGNNPGITQSGAVTVWGDMVLNGSGTYIKAAFPLTMRGCSLTNPGNITINGTNALTLNGSATAANALSFNSSFGNQSITLGSGSITSSLLSSLTINNSFTGGTVTLPSGLSIMPNATLSLINGIYNVGAGGTGGLTLGTAAAGTFTCVRTRGSISAATVTFGSGTTTKSYTYDGPGSIIPGPELTMAASPTIDALTLNNSTLKLTLNRPVTVKTALILNAGYAYTSNTNLLGLGSATALGTVTGGSSTSNINGPFMRIYPTGFVASGTYTGATLFPVAVKDSVYLPVYVEASTGAAPVQIRVTGADTNMGTNISPVGATLGNRHWEAIAINGTSSNLADDIRVMLVDGLITASNNIMSAVTAAGVYSSVVPSTTKSTGMVYTNAPGITAAAFNSKSYFSFGDGCNPLTGPNNICMSASGILVASTGNNIPTTGTWSSSAPGVVTVSASGNLIPIAPGTSTVLFIGNNPADACNTLSITRIVTVLTCVGAPGGVSSGLHTFIKADLGVTGANPVTAWANNCTGTTVLINGAPTLSNASGYNYNPVINFTGPVSPRQYLSLSGLNSGAGINYAALFTAANLTDLSRTITHFGVVNGISWGVATAFKTLCGGANGAFASLEFTASNPDFDGNNVWKQNGQFVSNTAIHLTTPHILSAVSYTGLTTVNRFFGGQDDNVGAGFFAHVRDWRGPVAELIGYTAAPSAANRNKIESYLALKYGVTLSNSGGGTAGDYLLSDGTTVWSAGTNPALHRQVIGIVRDDASALLQKQSHTQDDSLRLFLSTLAATNQANTGSISIDKSALVIGNDGGVPQWSSSVTKPASIALRLVRIFKVTNTGFSNNFSVEIKCDSIGGIYNLSDLRLLVSNSTDFSSAAVYGTPDVSFAFGSIIVNGISNAIIPPNSTRYMAVGLNLVVLPINLAAFKAQEVNNKWIQLEWHTTSENNNDYFTVQKSEDGFGWIDVAKIYGAANTNVLNKYNAIDNNPYTGISYYRLKQTDLGGKSTFSPVRKVHIRTTALVNIYPNPTMGRVTIEGDATELANIKVFNITGQDITNGVRPIANGKTRIILNLSGVSKGIYTIKTTTTANKIFRQ